MSDYKILHRKRYGRDSWEVYYNGRSLFYFTSEVRDYCGDLATNPYDSLNKAKKIIEAHKVSTKWLDEKKKLDMTEWLDEEGNPAEEYTRDIRPTQVITPLENAPTHKFQDWWICALAVAIVLIGALMVGA